MVVVVLVVLVVVVVVVVVVVKVKVVYSTSLTDLRATGRHLPYGITQC